MDYKLDKLDFEQPARRGENSALRREAEEIELSLFQTRGKLNEYLHEPIPLQWNLWLQENREKHNELDSEQMTKKLNSLTQEELILDAQFKHNYRDEDGRNYFAPMTLKQKYKDKQEYEKHRADIEKHILENEKSFVTNTQKKIEMMLLNGYDQFDIVRFVHEAMTAGTSKYTENLGLQLTQAKLFDETRVELAHWSLKTSIGKLATLFNNLKHFQETHIDNLRSSLEDVMWEKFRMWNVVYKDFTMHAQKDIDEAQARYDYFHDTDIRLQQKKREHRDWERSLNRGYDDAEDEVETEVANANE